MQNLNIGNIIHIQPLDWNYIRILSLADEHSTLYNAISILFHLFYASPFPPASKTTSYSTVTGPILIPLLELVERNALHPLRLQGLLIDLLIQSTQRRNRFIFIHMALRAIIKLVLNFSVGDFLKKSTRLVLMPVIWKPRIML